MLLLGQQEWHLVCQKLFAVIQELTYSNNDLAYLGLISGKQASYTKLDAVVAKLYKYVSKA